MEGLFSRKFMDQISFALILLIVLFLSVSLLLSENVPLFLVFALTCSKFGYFLIEFDYLYGTWTIINSAFAPIQKNLENLNVKFNRDSKNSRMHHLDALRGIAAIVVVLYHCTKLEFAEKQYSDAITQDSSHILFYPAKLGSTMVDFFVVLSGYVLGRVYWNSKRAKDFYKLFIGRAIRFYPLHWATTSVYFVAIVYIGFHFDDFYLQSLTFSRFERCYTLTHMWEYYFDSSWNTVRSCNGPSWSLSAEWMINIVMFIAIRLFPDFVSLFIFECIAVVGYKSVGTSMVFPLFHAFFVGCIASKLVGWIKIPLKPVKIIFDFLSIYQIMNFYSSVMLDADGQATLSHSEMGLKIVPYSTVLFILLDQSYYIPKLIGNSILKYIGKISFALYLSHIPLLMILKAIRADQIVVYNNVDLSGVILLILIVADLCNRFIEESSREHIQPLLGLKKLDKEKGYEEIPSDELEEGLVKSKH
eukprot:NODE_433_length_7485_cov_0.465746.p2 type:complete len:474 gc:universal NODE_433_length_7485_cov_0.465746:4666-6087(+)